MRWMALVWMIAGCGFASEPGSGTIDPGGGTGGSGSAAPGAPGTPAECDVSDAQLRLCVSFGGDHMAVDLATPAHALVDAVGVSPIAGIISSTAGAFGLTSRLRFAETNDFDVSDLTLDLWISPQLVPLKGKHAWLVDNNTQYYIAYDDNGAVRCGIGGGSVVSQAAVPIGSWHHVACTYARTDHKLRVHVDGAVAGCGTFDNGLPQGGMDGIAIGANYGGGKYSDNFVGNLDAVHVYARALSTPELCDAAGKTACSDQCQGQDQGGDQSDPHRPRFTGTR